MSWFSVDKEGLRQINERLVERRGFGVIVAELYQNVMDTDATVQHHDRKNAWEGRSRVNYS